MLDNNAIAISLMEGNNSMYEGQNFQSSPSSQQLQQQQINQDLNNIQQISTDYPIQVNQVIKRKNEIYEDSYLLEVNEDQALKQKHEQYTGIQRFLNYLPLIHQDNIFLIIWENLMAIIILLLFFIILIDRFITEPIWSTDDNHSILNKYVTIILIFLLYIDCLFVQINIAYNEKGRIISNKLQIAKNYLRFMFMIDFFTVTAVLIDLCVYNKQYNYFTLIFYLKIVYLVKYNSKMVQLLQLHMYLKALFKFLRLCLILLFFYNIQAVAFYSVGKYAVDHNQPSWLTINANNVDVLNGDKQLKYLMSMYWSVETASNAYGDLTPQNSWETLTCTIAIWLDCVVFGLSVSILYEILIEIRQFGQEIDLQTYAINKFMKEKNVDPALQRKVRTYLEYYLVNDVQLDMELANDVIDKLPPSMKQDVIFDSYGFFFKNIQWLEGFSLNFKKQLATCVEQQQFSSSNVIFDLKQQEQQANKEKYLYYILRGRVNITFRKNNTTYQIQLHNGEAFGEFDFLSDEQMLISAVADYYTVLYLIKFTNFMEALEQYPQDKLKYDSLTANKDWLLHNLSYIGLQYK